LQDVFRGDMRFTIKPGLDLADVSLSISKSLFFKFGLHQYFAFGEYSINSIMGTFTFSCYGSITSTHVDLISHLLTISLNADNCILENSDNLIMGYINLSESVLLNLLRQPKSVYRYSLDANCFDITHSYLNDLNIALMDAFGKRVLTNFFECTCEIDFL
jgi:hypothetical protein